MTTTTTRKHGVLLTVLDLSGVEAEALEKYNDLTEKPASALKAGFKPYAMAEHDGHMYVVCEEGVGWEVSDDQPLEVALYPEWGDPEEGSYSFSVVPTMAAVLSPGEVKALATGPEVDLADHVREFGARLESNFAVWYDTLTAGEET